MWPGDNMSRHQFGATIGGPLVIPGVYDGRNKTFFMFGYERITDKRPRFDMAGTSWVPTEALRNGDSLTEVFNYTVRDAAGATSAATLS